MRSVVVTGPDQTQWTVRVAWEPRWRALARRFGGWRRSKQESDPLEKADQAVQLGDAMTGGPGGGGGGSVGSGGGSGGSIEFGEAVIVILIAGIAIVVAAVLFWWVLLPLLLLVLDAIIVVILVVLAVLGRVLFRRPWTVEATSSTGERRSIAVVGWRAALRRRDELAAQLERGDPSVTESAVST